MTLSSFRLHFILFAFGPYTIKLLLLMACLRAASELDFGAIDQGVRRRLDRSVLVLIAVVVLRAQTIGMAPLLVLLGGVLVDQARLLRVRVAIVVFCDVVLLV